MIYGERIRFRMVRVEDLPQFVEWLNDPEVRKGLSISMPMSADLENSWYETNKAKPAQEQALIVEIKNDETWRMIGSVGLFGFDWIARGAEVGILIGDKAEWNKGYGTEIMQLMLKHGFQTLNLHRIYLRVFANNPRAHQVYQKVGYVEEGRMREVVYQDGEYLDVILMSVLRSEWQTKMKN